MMAASVCGPAPFRRTFPANELLFCTTIGRPLK
jgi:hypothetical protein